MEKESQTLPLGGDVRVKGDDEGEVYVYLGYEGSNSRRCAVAVRGDEHIMWFDRNVLIPVGEA